MLEPKNILLTEFGSVKIGTVTHSTQHVWRTIRSFTDDDGRDGITIAGVENSRPIEPPEPTAASLQLVSLASIVDSLLVKNGASHPWSSMIRELPSKLRERPIEELIKVRSSHKDPEMHSFRLPLLFFFFNELRIYALQPPLLFNTRFFFSCFATSLISIA